MQIVRDLAGYSMGRSDLVRRAMSKKKHDVMNREKQYFIHGKLGEDGTIEVPGAVRNGIPEQVAERLFDEMSAFASYAFNKSHAAAYGIVAVQTAWLKRHHPVEFMAALMNSVTGNTAKVAFYIDYCKKRDIQVLPPDVNASGERFSVDRSGAAPAIRFGLGAVKNVGKGAIRVIENEVRERGPFQSLFDFIDRVSGEAVNKKAVECLIKAGALDGLPGYRSQKLAVFERALDGAAKSKKTVIEGQMSLFGGEAAEKLPPPPFPPAQDLDVRTRLTMEREMTGVYISGHPLDEYKQELARATCDSQYLQSLAEEAPDGGLSMDGKYVFMGGLIAEKRMKATRNGGMMAFVQLEDLYGVTEVLVFPRVYEQYGPMLEADALVLLRGRLSIREEDAPKLLLESVQPLLHQPGQPAAPAPRRMEAPADLSDLPASLREPIEYHPPRRREARRLTLVLPGREALEKAARLLMPTPGAIPVIFEYPQEQRRETAPRNLWVDEQFRREALQSAFGENCLRLEG